MLMYAAGRKLLGQALGRRMVDCDGEHRCLTRTITKAARRGRRPYAAGIRERVEIVNGG